MTVTDIIKQYGITNEYGKIGRYSTVSVTYKNEGEEASAHFSIENVYSRAGKQNISEQFKKFCKKNKIAPDSAEDIIIVFSTNSQKKFGVYGNNCG